MQLNSKCSNKKYSATCFFCQIVEYLKYYTLNTPYTGCYVSTVPKKRFVKCYISMLVLTLSYFFVTVPGKK